MQTQMFEEIHVNVKHDLESWVGPLVKWQHAHNEFIHAVLRQQIEQRAGISDTGDQRRYRVYHLSFDNWTPILNQVRYSWTINF